MKYPLYEISMKFRFSITIRKDNIRVVLWALRFPFKQSLLKGVVNWNGAVSFGSLAHR
jgi:hypothetical protein